MNKHFILGVVAASAMMLTTACSSDDDFGATNGDIAKVSFNLQADASLKTRAISDGSGADVLVYRVFDENGGIIAGQAKITQTGLTDLKTGHNVTLNLAKGQTYKVAFWAQDDDCEAYSLDENMNVTINYTGYNNDETRDAFFKTEEITVNSDMSVNVELQRPFAQVNVGCTPTDWTNAVNSGITVNKSTVTIIDAATKLSILDGKVSGAQTVTYEAAAIPTETLKVDADGDGIKDDYHYLSMSYILPNDGTTGYAKTVANASFVFKSNGNDITLSEGLQNIPLQRNYRTNIVGTFLTSAVNINVIVDSEFKGEYTVGPALINGVAYPSIQAAIDAATPGTVLEVVPGNYNEVLNLQTVANDITIQPFVMTRSASEEVVLSGVNCQRNGENLPTITFKNVTIDNSLATENWFTGTGKCAPCVGAWGGNLSFENVKFVVAGTSGKETGVMTWWTTSVGKMTFKNCTFEGKGNHAEARGMQIYGHYNIDVEGCTFTTAKRYSLKYVAQEGCTANLKNNIVKNANYFVEIGSEPYKGTKYTINYEGNTLYGADLYKEGYTNAITTEIVTVNESNNTLIIADGLTLCNGVYSISNANGLVAFAQNSYSNTTINIESDINLTSAWSSLALTGTITINGNNHKIAGLTQPLIKGTSAIELTVKNLTIEDSHIGIGFENGLGTGAFISFIDYSGKAIFENCHLLNSSVTGNERAAAFISYSTGSEITITNCSTTGSTIIAVGGAGGLVGYTTATTTISNSKVEGSTIEATEIRGEGKAAVAGAVMGTVNGPTTFTNVTVSNNTVKNHNANGDLATYNDKVGRIVGGSLTDN